MKDPSTNDSFPIHPTGPDGLLFEGPAYRYTFVSPLLDAPDPMAIARRTPVKGEGAACSVILERVQMPPRTSAASGPSGMPAPCCGLHTQSRRKTSSANVRRSSPAQSPTDGDSGNCRGHPVFSGTGLPDGRSNTLARRLSMKLAKTVVLAVFFIGCATTQRTDGPGTGGSGPSPSPGARPAVKKELPWLNVPGGRMKTTFFYGPWQCRREFMNGCQRECASEGHTLKGCMWLADLKFDWEGSLVVLPVPVKAGSRYGIYHCCCCDYTELSKQATRAERARLNMSTGLLTSFGRWVSRTTGC